MDLTREQKEDTEDIETAKLGIVLDSGEASQRMHEVADDRLAKRDLTGERERKRDQEDPLTARCRSREDSAAMDSINQRERERERERGRGT